MGVEVVLIIVVLTFVTLLARTFRIVPQQRVGIIQRLGTYNRSADAGLAVVLPFLDKMLPLIDTREQVVSFQPQPVITSDNVTINVTSVIYYQILDAKNATYQVANLLPAMEQIAQTTLRNVMGSLTLDTSLTSRDEINARLRVVLDEVTERWGVRINRVELKDISPPKDIQIAMEKQMQAERNKRAAILTAEGEAQAAILRADGAKKALILSSEGERQSSILRAEGDGKALITMQEAQAQSIRMLMDAVNDSGAPSEAMQLQYMQMLPKLADNPANKLFVVPADMAGLAGLATSVAQMTQELPAAQGMKNGQIQAESGTRSLGEDRSTNGATPQLNATNPS
ncbi:MAG TPA: SPFH domain-containing protein [Chloroflexota bacterium]|jgi:regulator of protease activity HflC (stomatin/prohibitin superfamily)|nr:SPFH domain-containing protein [Chloroflexota bacterium]